MIPAGKVPEVLASELRFDLVLPVLRIGVGVFAFDALERLVGAPLSEILASLLRAEIYKRPSASGTSVEVYPLALPDGEGATVPLGQFGELGLANRAGVLELTVPLRAAGWVEQRLAGSMVQPRQDGPSLDGASTVATFWLRLRPGMRAGFPLGALGEVSVEAK